MIELKNVSVNILGKPILNKINLLIEKGEILVIIGSSGSGKSTLLRLIIGLLRPTEGQIWVNGRNVSIMNENDLNKVRLEMSMVFQYSALFDSLNVGENVAFGLRQHTKLSDEEIRKIVREKLSMVDLAGEEENMPNSLSGGMKKRVSLARAIATNPHIVLYDEPTSGLDPINSRVIDELIMNMRKMLGVTSVVVTHDISSAFAIADRIVMLYEGAIIAIGAPSEIYKSENFYVQKFIRGLHLETSSS